MHNQQSVKFHVCIIAICIALNLCLSYVIIYLFGEFTLTDWKLEWSDEFSTHALNSSVWERYANRYDSQADSNDSSALRLSGGFLIMKCHRRLGNNYESHPGGVRLRTIKSEVGITGWGLDLLSPTSRLRFMISVRLPLNEHFLFRAFLTLVGGNENTSGKMVLIENDSRIFQNLEYYDPDHNTQHVSVGWGEVVTESDVLEGRFDWRAFHTYWVEWYHGGVIFGIDQRVTRNITIGPDWSQNSTGIHQNPIELLQSGRKMTINMEMTRCGQISDELLASRNYKTCLEIDYVRVYSKP